MSRYEDAETRPDKPDTRNWKKRAPWVAGTMLWGCFGGWVFSQLGIPLAWMIGAMIFTAGAAITGVRLQGPGKGRGRAGEGQGEVAGGGGGGRGQSRAFAVPLV